MALCSTSRLSPNPSVWGTSLAAVIIHSDFYILLLYVRSYIIKNLNKNIEIQSTHSRGGLLPPSGVYCTKSILQASIFLTKQHQHPPRNDEFSNLGSRFIYIYGVLICNTGDLQEERVLIQDQD